MTNDEININLIKSTGIYILALVLFFSCGNKEKISDDGVEIPQHVSIAAPDSVFAGNSFFIDILSSGKSWKNSGEVWVTAALGTYVFPINEKIEIDSSITKKSGILFIDYRVKDIGYASKKVMIKPREGIGTLPSFVGPKSILTTMKTPAMIIGNTVDEFGNPVAEGTEHQYNLLRPDLSEEQHFIKTKNLLSHYTFYAKEKTGKTLIGITADNARSEERHVDEQPGSTTTAEMEAFTGKLKADGRSFVSLSTEKLLDKLGNSVVDGTLVNFFVESKNYRDTYTGITVDGRAKFNLRHPEREGIFTVRANCDGITGKTISLEFVSAFKPFNITYNKQEGLLEIGPVYSYLGQLVPDDDEIIYRITNEDNLRINGITETRKGWASISLDELFLDKNKNYNIICEIGGKEETFDFIYE